MLAWRLMADGDIEEIDVAVHGAVVLPDDFIPSLMSFLGDVVDVDHDDDGLEVK